MEMMNKNAYMSGIGGKKETLSLPAKKRTRERAGR